MTKFTIVYDHLGTIHSNLELPLYREYFNIVPYQSGVLYDPKTTVYYTDALKKSSVYDDFLSRGFCIVYDGLHEPGIKFSPASGYVLQHQDYMWYHDSLQYIAHGWNTYVPQKTYKKLALMPMNLQKSHRTQLLERMVAYLDDCYWSYASLGRTLPFEESTLSWSGQRHFDPRWYDDTYFSIVAETRISAKANTPLLVSEKTFKAMAYYHPFLIWGEAGTLQHLKKLGFETFDNLFDETYDTLLNSTNRLTAMVSNVPNFIQTPYDKITLEKIQHNHARFFDQAYIEDCIKKEIIEPLLEYIEATL